MYTQTKLNISSIAGVKKSIHEIFSLIEQNLDAYSQDLKDEKHIDSCRTYINQLHGLFKMLELNSITVITEKIEQLITTWIDKKIASTQASVDIVKRAANALDIYLDELVEGADENPMRLFPAYRDLMFALGYQQASEFDLFYPSLTNSPALKPVFADNDAKQLKTSAKRARIEYQTGLVRWLKDTSSKDNLKKMHDAIIQAEQFPGTTEQRTFWWIAAGFLENLLILESDIQLQDRKLCGKIEQILRHLAEGSRQDLSQLTRELLFQIATSQPSTASEQIAAIRKAYKLPYTEESTTLDMTSIASRQSGLQEIRKTLKQASENWQSFCTGESTALTAFLDDMARMYGQSPQLQCPPLQHLIESINNATLSLKAQAHLPQTNERATMEVATALLNLESIIENFNQLTEGLAEQVEMISERLKSIDETKETLFEKQTVPLLSEIENPAQKKKLQIKTAQEVLSNLQQIEKTLEQFFQTTADRSVLSTLSPLFIQTSGVLDMLELQSANHLLNHCHNLVKQFSDPAYAPTQTDQDLLVDGISSLSFFLEAFKNDQTANNRIIESAIAVFENAINQKTKSASSTIDALEIGPDFEETEHTEPEITTDDYSEPKIQIDSGVDPELLSVFLEEADEILNEISECIQKCLHDQTDLTSLASIRRGFHTLKGSGRMVKLEFLSEAAWAMEKTLNHWLNDNKHVTDGLIHLMEYAHQAFKEWCDNLKACGKSEIQSDKLVDLINRLSQEEEKEKCAPADFVARGNKTETTDTPKATVSIGGISIPAELFEIFVVESKQHLATLEQEFKALLTEQTKQITQPFTIATHTLASTSRALRLNFIADLSSKLETWLTTIKEADAKINESDMYLIQNCIQQISELLNKVHLQQFPDETDLQLVDFLSQEIIKHQTQNNETTKPDSTCEPINLSDYRLKKTPPVVLSEVSSEKKQEEASDSTLDHISNELLQVFLEEAKDTIPQISAKLRAWRILPQNEDIRISLLRFLHTLKGSAHMISAQQLGELIHTMEEDIEQAFNDPVVSNNAIDKVEYQFDQICERIEQLQPKEIAVDTPNTTDKANAAIADSMDSPSPIITAIPSPPASPTLHETISEEAHQPISVLRVNAELIDRLVNESGESSIIRTKIEAQLSNFKQSLQDLTESIDRLHGQLREIEIQAETQMQSHIAQQETGEQSFDPLELDRFTRFQELTRLMAESVDDVFTVQKNLSTTHSAASEAVAQQAILNNQLQQELIRIRTVPFGSIAERYYRIIRKTASDLGKKTNLRIQGEETEIDRSVLEKITASLEHILRNAVAHGIESPDQRIKSGKPETGEILMRLQREGNEVIITIGDDGHGLDLENIRKEAIKLSLINNNENLDDDQIAALIFAPGLTTQAHPTATSGRGIGMDIVQNDISGLGGHITVSSKKNKETVFRIQLPLTLAVAQSFVVSSGKQIFAIPTPVVAHVQELNSVALQSAYREQQINFDGNTYPFTYLPFFLGQFEQKPETKKYNHILLLQSGDLRLAVHIDELIDNREVIVKNTGPQIMHAPGVEGATITGEGMPVLILNPLKLLHREDVQRILKTPVSEIINQLAKKEASSATILVVDDSLTVRKVTSRLLEREGYNVLTAKQGVEAVEMITEKKPDIILADLEMPKMNGFELIQNIRSNPDSAHIPIIIITSRTAEKHRKMAIKLGANEFLGKPYKEQDLLDHISHYVPKKPQ